MKKICFACNKVGNDLCLICKHIANGLTQDQIREKLFNSPYLTLRNILVDAGEWQRDHAWGCAKAKAYYAGWWEKK